MNTMRRAPGRRWHLREATASLHEDLDRMIGTFTDRASYAAYVTALYRFRTPIEQALPPETGTRLAPLIARDLGDLGVQSPAAPPCPPVTGSAILGTLYVLEGAALGGQILRKRAATIGMTGDHGARHLATGTDGWIAFLATLENAAGYDADVAASAANDTFARALEAFTGTIVI